MFSTLSNIPSDTPFRCWVLTPGAAGMENQALGLAEAMGLSPDVLRLTVPKPYSLVPPNATFLAKTILAASHLDDGKPLPEVLPQLLIACGRRVILPAIALKQRAGNAMMLVYLQDPRIDPKHFDWVVTPEHDPIRGPNVLITQGALHRVSRARVDQAANEAEAWMVPGRPSRIAVLIGGTSKAYTLTPRQAAEIGTDLRALAEQGHGLMVSTSRRTDPAAADQLEAALQGTGAVFYRPDKAEGRSNPYFVFLGLADTILVTGDSVSMVSEAASLGRPTGIIALPPRPGRARKIESFLGSVLDRGSVSLFTGALPPPSENPLNEASRIASTLLESKDFQRVQVIGHQ